MAEMNCPYDEITLKVALIGLNSKMEDESLAIRVKERMSEFLITDKSELNKKIAEHNGVGVLDIINSPNYITLKEEFSKTLLLKTIEVLKEETFSDTEAWAIITLATGVLKF